MDRIATVILAAGRGTRFRSALPKVVHKAAGLPLMGHVLRVARGLKSAHCVLVVSPEIGDSVRAGLGGDVEDCHIALQQTPRGTGDAVRQAHDALRNFDGFVLVLAGDVPLISTTTLRKFVRQAQRMPGVGAVLAMELEDPYGYGRVVCDGDGHVASIVEERDADEATAALSLVNTGVFCCRADWLFSALTRLSADNAQGEYYLTDIAGIAAQEGAPLGVVSASDPAEFAGVNTRADLAYVESEFRMRLTEYWMARGVSFVDPDSVQIDVTAKIGQDTIIEPMVSLRGNTRVGSDCVVGQGAVLTNCRVGSGVQIHPYSVLEESRVGDACQLGPFARLRPGTRLDRGVKIGNFVETKATWMKRGAKASHLSYLGDATIGADTNIGCGTITCNYDGAQKHHTVIGDNVFVGSDSQFVAPVRIGTGATIAAGSVITDNVPKGSLAIARGRQVVKKNWKRHRT